MLALLSGCIASPEAHDVPWEIVARAGDSPWEFQSGVITSQEAWNETWNQVGARMPEQETPPQIDFTNARVVAVAAGGNSSCDSIEVSRVFESESSLVVQARVVSDYENMCSWALVHPVVFVEIPKGPENVSIQLDIGS